MDKQLAASILGVPDKVAQIKQLVLKDINWIHYDVMDGMFVPNKSLPIAELDYVLTNTPNHIVDIHLMVNDPLFYIMKLEGKFNYLTLHYEAESIDRLKKIMKNYAHKHNIGIAIKPGTNIEQIYEFLHDVSHVLIMTVEPGKGGQKFQTAMLDKIIKLKNYLNKIKKYNVFIQVDGGINDQTGPQALAAGAVSLVSGSFLLQNLDQPEVLQKMLKPASS